MKLKNIILASFAALSISSVISITTFAAEDNILVATVPKENGEIVEIYKNDISANGYTVNCGSYTITIDGSKTNNIMATRAINTGIFKTGFPTLKRQVSGTSNWKLTFSVDKGITKPKYTPYQYAPISAVSPNSIAYHFISDANYGNKVYSTVYCVDNDNYSPVTLYFADGNEDGHVVAISGMTPSNYTYATVTNSTYSNTATGTCIVSN